MINKLNINAHQFEINAFTVITFWLQVFPIHNSAVKRLFMCKICTHCKNLVETSAANINRFKELVQCEVRSQSDEQAQKTNTHLDLKMLLLWLWVKSRMCYQECKISWVEHSIDGSEYFRSSITTQEFEFKT